MAQQLIDRIREAERQGDELEKRAAEEAQTRVREAGIRAAELIHSRPDSSLTAISEQVGYTDPYYFSRCFKQYYGVTPSKFLFSHAQQEPAGDERRERRDEGGTLQN